MTRTLGDRLQRSEAPAIDDGVRSWSYAELHHEIAAWCERLPVGPGDAFGWLGLNSVTMLAALFACEQRQARFVPLNWRLSASELRTIAAHAGLKAWHADAGFDVLDGVAPQPLAGEPPHRDLLLVYTSGTTGEPKGAVHTPAAMLANARAAIDVQGFDARTRTLAVLPLFHVGGLCIQILPTLLAGGCVRLLPRFEPDAWFDAVAQWRPTTSLLVPATMRALIEHPRWPDADLSALAFVNSGSQIVPRALIDAFHARGVPVCQVYGATETGPLTCALRPREALTHAGSVGRPVAGVELRFGEGGELHVRAPQNARGYHRLPHDPAFGPDGFFRTGDLATIDGDGFVTIVGRSKELIISGGENIHPAELEHLALEDPAVAEAAAIGVADARWGEVAWLALVARPGQTIDEARLRAAFDARLARFKHPRRIVELDALPRTALGKVQRGALLATLRP
jgi:fatty-acyl-CoA synthase